MDDAVSSEKLLLLSASQHLGSRLLRAFGPRLLCNPGQALHIGLLASVMRNAAAFQLHSPHPHSAAKAGNAGMTESAAAGFKMVSIL